MATVAIIGAGPHGLAMLKNLLEEGFEASVFEKRSTIGSLWQFTEDEAQPSVLKSTLGNVSKYRNCLTDFPCPTGHTGAHDRPADGGVSRVVARSVDDEKWGLIIQRDERHEVRTFDKVVFSKGRIDTPHVPEIESIEMFTGKVLHSQAFKRPERSTGEKIIIVGVGNTAADIASDLVGIAEKVYVSHRGGQNIFSRWAKGAHLDLFSNCQKAAILQLITYLAPQRARTLFKDFGEKLADSCYELDPAWGFKPAPFVLTHTPLISETLVDHLRSGAVQSIPIICRSTGPKRVELDDDTNLEVDTMIFCIGYKASFSLAPDLVSGVRLSDSPRLYKNTFPPGYTESIVFLNCWQTGDGIAAICDMIAMAVAQIWKGTSPLPNREDVERDIDADHLWAKSMCDPGKKPAPYLVNKEQRVAWLNNAAGTGVNENLGYGWQGWRFWLSDPRFCGLLMGGIDSPNVWRLFDGRRRKWMEAREAIVRANEDLKKQIEDRKRTRESGADAKAKKT